MKYLQVRQEGERLVFRQSHAPLANDALTFGGISTALCWGAWKSWALSMGGLPLALSVLAVGTGVGAAKMWRQLERALANDESWIFDRAVDKIEHRGQSRCAVSDVTQVYLDLDWRHEAHSLLLKRLVGPDICIESRTLPNDEMTEAARLIADFVHVELVVMRHD